MQTPLRTQIRRIALVWWVRNLNRKNHERAARWESIAARYA